MPSEVFPRGHQGLQLAKASPVSVEYVSLELLRMPLTSSRVPLEVLLQVKHDVSLREPCGNLQRISNSVVFLLRPFPARATKTSSGEGSGRDVWLQRRIKQRLAAHFTKRHKRGRPTMLIQWSLSVVGSRDSQTGCELERKGLALVVSSPEEHMPSDAASLEMWNRCEERRFPSNRLDQELLEKLEAAGRLHEAESRRRGAGSDLKAKAPRTARAF